MQIEVRAALSSHATLLARLALRAFAAPFSELIASMNPKRQRGKLFLRPDALAWFCKEPESKSLRTDPRFAPLVRKIGFTEP